jgi:hypothetical protein
MSHVRWGSCGRRLYAVEYSAIEEGAMTIRELIRTPGGFLPFVLSGGALALLLGYVALYGVSTDPQGDEGAAARLFQLMLVAQSVIMVVFAMVWVPRAVRPALFVLALQAAAAAIPVATILLIEAR